MPLKIPQDQAIDASGAVEQNMQSERRRRVRERYKSTRYKIWSIFSAIVFWAWALNWLGFRFPAMGKVLSPPPLPLVGNGHSLRRNMRRELVTEDELMSQLRLQGLNTLSAVKEAVMESDGRISVVPKDEYRSHGAREKQVG